MAVTRRYPLDGGRTLVTAPWSGTDMLVVEVHAAGGACVGALAIRRDDIPTLADAVEALRIEAAIEGDHITKERT